MEGHAEGPPTAGMIVVTAARGLVEPEEIPGQPDQAEHRPVDRAGEDPTQTRLTRMQYRPGLIDGFLAKTGLDLTPS